MLNFTVIIVTVTINILSSYMKKLLDPSANAKTFGFLLIILGGIDLLSVPSMLNTSSSIILVYTIIQSILYLGVGIGLRKLSIWGMYGLLAISIGSILWTFYIASTGISILIFSIGLFINLLILTLAIWLYKHRSIFS